MSDSSLPIASQPAQQKCGLYLFPPYLGLFIDILMFFGYAPSNPTKERTLIPDMLVWMVSFIVGGGFTAVMLWTRFAPIHLQNKPGRRQQALPDKEPKIMSPEQCAAEEKLGQLIQIIPDDWTEVREKLRKIATAHLPALIDRRDQLWSAVKSLDHVIMRYECLAPESKPRPIEPVPPTDHSPQARKRYIDEKYLYDLSMGLYREAEARLVEYRNTYEFAQLQTTRDIRTRLNEHHRYVSDEVRACLIFLDNFEATIYSHKLLRDESGLHKTLSDMAERAAEHARRDSLVEKEIRTVEEHSGNVIPLHRALQKQGGE